jgi:hypothetical protein
MWHKNMGLISKMIDKMLIMLLPQFASVQCTSAKDISDGGKSHFSHTKDVFPFQISFRSF